MGTVRQVGKESNRLEDVTAGQVHDLDEVLNEYSDPTLYRLTVILRHRSIRDLARKAGVSRSTLQRARNANSKLRKNTILKLLAATSSD